MNNNHISIINAGTSYGLEIQGKSQEVLEAGFTPETIANPYNPLKSDLCRALILQVLQNHIKAGANQLVCYTYNLAGKGGINLGKSNYNDAFYKQLEIAQEATKFGKVDRKFISARSMSDSYKFDSGLQYKELLDFYTEQFRTIVTYGKNFNIDTAFVEAVPSKQEAIAAIQVAKKLGIKIQVNFFLDDTHGLVNGIPLRTVIEEVDKQTGCYAECYGVNCCKLKHIELAIQDCPAGRIKNAYPNASHEDKSCLGTHTHNGDTQDLKIIQQTSRKIIALAKKYNLERIGYCCGGLPIHTKSLTDVLRKQRKE